MNDQILRKCRPHDWFWRFDSGDGWKCGRCGARLDATGTNIQLREDDQIECNLREDDQIRYYLK